jgi:hypothetical protein
MCYVWCIFIITNELQKEMSSSKAISHSLILRPWKDIRPTAPPPHNSPSHIFSNSPMSIVATFTDNKHFGLSLRPNEAEEEIQQFAEWGEP